MNFADRIFGTRKRRTQVYLTDDAHDLPLRMMDASAYTNLMLDRLGHADLIIAATKLQQQYNAAKDEIERLNRELLDAQAFDLDPDVSSKQANGAVDDMGRQIAKMSADHERQLQEVRTSYRDALTEHKVEVDRLRRRVLELEGNAQRM